MIKPRFLHIKGKKPLSHKPGPWVFKTDSCYVAQSHLELKSFCLSFLNTGIKAMYYLPFLARKQVKAESI